MTVVRKLAAGLAVLAAAVLAGIGIAQADGTPLGQQHRSPHQRAGVVSTSAPMRAGHGPMWTRISLPLMEYASASTIALSPDAPVVGGQIGIQHQFGLFVLGIEAIRHVRL